MTETFIEALREAFGEHLVSYSFDYIRANQVYTSWSGAPVVQLGGPTVVSLRVTLRHSHYELATQSRDRQESTLLYLDDYAFGSFRPNSMTKMHTVDGAETILEYRFSESDEKELIKALKEEAYRRFDSKISKQIDEVIND